MNDDFKLVDEVGNVDELNAQRKKAAFQYDREKTFLKAYLLGRNYFTAIKALGFIERYEFSLPQEKRFRKDKVTPSLHHQIRIALAVTQLKGLDDKNSQTSATGKHMPCTEELCIIAALLHDIQEDHKVPYEEIKVIFGRVIADITWRMTKKFAGTIKNKEEYVREISLCRICSIVKPLDRNDNLYHMIGVFDLPKMTSYSDEAETVFLQVIKIGSKMFPDQMQAYHSISVQMKRQIKFIRQYVAAAEIEGSFDSVSFAYDELAADAKKNEQELIALRAENENLQKRVSAYGVASELIMSRGHLTSEETKQAFGVMAKCLLVQKGNRLMHQDITIILGELAQALKISVLELEEYFADKLSD